jgi:tetratricopeptide (TPR) repeat protein
MSQARETIAEARSIRTAGDAAAAEQLYRQGAALARSEDDDVLRAHALRHVSDLARERGDVGEALAAAEEAVTLYRAAPDARPLDLANALRQLALALEGAGHPQEAVPAWQEARGLYARVDVQAGVEEADRHLAV